MKDGEQFKGLVEEYLKVFGDAIEVKPEFRGEVAWVVKRERLVEVLGDLKRKSGFNFLLDICSVDHFGEEPRFEVVYELCNLDTFQHLRVKTAVSEEDGEVPTVTGIWRTANWHEREIFDMMGLKFAGHPNLKRILMWEGYPYHPLLKDFPLEGKESEMPDIAFSRPAPLEGGPFVTSPSGLSKDREPRSRAPRD